METGSLAVTTCELYRKSGRIQASKHSKLGRRRESLFRMLLTFSNSVGVAPREGIEERLMVPMVPRKNKHIGKLNKMRIALNWLQ